MDEDKELCYHLSWAQRGAGAALPGCWTSGPPQPPAVLSSGPGTARRRSAGAVDLQWAEPVAPRGTGPPKGEKSVQRDCLASLPCCACHGGILPGPPWSCAVCPPVPTSRGVCLLLNCTKPSCWRLLPTATPRKRGSELGVMLTGPGFAPRTPSHSLPFIPLTLLSTPSTYTSSTLSSPSQVT